MGKSVDRKRKKTVSRTTMPIAQLSPAPYNPRKISDRALAGLRASIEEYGLVQEIVFNQRTGHVVGGHQRLKVIEESGVKEVPVAIVDLSEREEQALNIALNNPNIAGEFTDALQPLLKQIEADLPELMKALNLDELQVSLQDRQAGRTDPNEIPSPRKHPTTAHGDLWTLGEHRLLCGDATSENDVSLLMGGRRAQMMWTDPPYGVNYTGKTKEALTIKNDTPGTLVDLLTKTWSCALQVLLDGSPFYIAHPAGERGLDFGNTLRSAGWKIHQTIIWIKDSMVLGHSDYHYRHEPIYYGWVPGPGRSGRGSHEGSRWYGGNDQDSVFEIPRPKASPDHPTGKPVELVDAHLLNSSRPGDIVYDPFLGSGSTMIASEQRGRQCYGLEVDPTYCDVIVERWQNFTGGKARRARGR